MEGIYRFLVVLQILDFQANEAKEANAVSKFLI